MKKLIETIHGADCEIYGILHHERILLGKAVPEVEIYEERMGSQKIGFRRESCHLMLEPNQEMNLALLTSVQDWTAFDLSMWLPRSADGVLVPFAVCGVTAAELSPEKWVFAVEDAEVVKRLRAL